MDDEVEIPSELHPVLDQVLEPGVIPIGQRVGSSLPGSQVVMRINHHFAHAELGYRAMNGDSFRLKVRGRKYPLFGSFTGTVHVIKETAPSPKPAYRVEGLLEYRLSILWFLSTLGFFFLLVYLTHPGLWLGAILQTAGTAVTIYTTYHLGRSERDEVEERVQASFLLLRTTLQNLR